jgi:hypothetical protein
MLENFSRYIKENSPGNYENIVISSPVLDRMLVNTMTYVLAYLDVTDTSNSHSILPMSRVLTCCTNYPSCYRFIHRNEIYLE